MAETILITGGTRSGKSRLAEELAARRGTPRLYLATGRAGDVEMAARIARHRERRGEEWQTIEEPLDLAGVLTGHDGWFRAVLVDCVTLWLTNLFFHHAEESGPVLEEVRRLATLLPTLQSPVILVTNEVGMGIVPDNSLARKFRDLAGETNEILAAAADEVYVTFSGLPLKLK